MEQSSMDDDRPYLRPTRSAYPWLAIVGALCLVVAAGAYYYYGMRSPEPAAEAPAPAPSAESPPAPQSSAEPAIRHPLEVPEVPEAGLPTLENSDTAARRSLVEILGGKAFAEFVVPDQLVRRIVATVDNLPRPTAPRRMMPLNQVPGAFGISSMGNERIIDEGNAARYLPYVRVFESVDAGALVSAYVRAYPLFQRAYEELGYPGRYFNDRLVEAIDDMLAAPEPAGPLRVVQGRVLYEFADPELETRSAGQKVMLRMGSANAAKVKAKLLEIRQALVAARQRKP